MGPPRPPLELTSVPVHGQGFGAEREHNCRKLEPSENLRIIQNRIPDELRNPGRIRMGDEV